jgi:predicted nucleotidyltransferase
MQHNDRSWVDKSTILRVEVGSGVHGIAQAGTDDVDHMGVCLEPYELAFGIKDTYTPQYQAFEPFEQYIYRDAEEWMRREGRTLPKGEVPPSRPGDLDLTIFSLRKWCRLALQGNPTILMLLFSPIVIKIDPRGQNLRNMAPMFASRRAGARFTGYLTAQREKLLGERGQMNVNRRDLVEKFGYDTKFAGHMIRLGYQGIEFMTTGKITLPMPEVQRARVLAIRQGRVMLGEVLTEVSHLEQELADLQTTSPLPEFPAVDEVEEWMLNAYHEHWKAGWGHERHMKQARLIWARKARV